MHRDSPGLESDVSVELEWIAMINRSAGTILEDTILDPFDEKVMLLLRNAVSSNVNQYRIMGKPHIGCIQEFF